MKTTININNKAVEIELTTEQVEAIKKASEKITDRVKTYEDACKIFGIDPSKIMLTYPDQLSVKDANSIVAFAKLQTIAKALNEGWEPDWSNANQPKYYPWFKWVVRVPGSRVSAATAMARIRLSAPASYLKAAS
ncbi:hypothetical protein [Pedobacter sp.]|uniref:hypothetical protein n=1 Tax=Pedobacter sp. TaxID=1411316 RepID=UPI00396C53D1